jgi:hypothetical protein
MLSLRYSRIGYFDVETAAGAVKAVGVFGFITSSSKFIRFGSIFLWAVV